MTGRNVVKGEHNVEFVEDGKAVATTSLDMPVNEFLCQLWEERGYLPRYAFIHCDVAWGARE
jgi:hypothetical protein